MHGNPNLLFMSRQMQRTPFGERLHRARTEAGLTQPQLAALVVMGQSTLAEAERIGQGSSFTPQLAAACGVDAHWLATGEGEPRPEKVLEWPFDSVPLARFNALTEKNRGIVEGRVVAAIEECEKAERILTADDKRRFAASRTIKTDAALVDKKAG